MLLDPNRWPKPRGLLDSPARFALGSVAFMVLIVVLLYALPALAD
jgi:hypothetical protein